MCWLRGEVYNKLNHRDSAKKSWLEALKVDYKCYEVIKFIALILFINILF
jgi:predicted negative regulator of RcsB-dependent stress response